MKIQLSDWTLRDGRGNSFSCSVPCSYYDLLIREGKMPSPSYRINEKEFAKLFGDDCVMEAVFTVAEEDVAHDYKELVFEGIDTLSEVYLNGEFVGETDNMHRTWCFDVEDCLKLGENKLEVCIRSAVTYFKEMQRKHPLKGNGDTIPGFPHIRKASYMMGWDWGPTLPDMGIWRPAYLLTYDTGRMISDVEIRQIHNPDGSVTLNVLADAMGWADTQEYRVSVTAPDGRVYAGEQTAQRYDKSAKLGRGYKVEISEPQLWWPNGYGEQNLYEVKVELLCDGDVVDTNVKRVGLRTLNISQTPDRWGKEFCFIVNGVKIFSMGANYIPEENMMSRRSREKTADLIKLCREGNFNTLRVWGGGIYPDDWFFDLCDENGIIVWLDFMFACSTVWLTDKFKETVVQEAIDNVKRIRHRASLGLLCGNNECEEFLVAYTSKAKMPDVVNDYIELYCHILPDICEEYAPDTFYWSSSPSSGTILDNPGADDVGDRHIWTVWSGLKPIDMYKTYYPRFCSEFGFESFPDVRTIEEITLPQDRNLFSEVMEAHQKHKNGNGKLMYYIAQYYNYPTEFNKVVYATQVMQERAIRTAVEHFRRNRGRCMGSIYWQLNDCWPVASWSAIDYNHRPKALYYGSKRFFAPTLLSAVNDGDTVRLNVSNERREGFEGTVKYRLRSTLGEVLLEREAAVKMFGPSAADVAAIAISEIPSDRIRNIFLEYELLDADGSRVSWSSMLFVKPKQFEYPEVKLSAKVLAEGEGRFRIELTADRFARKVQISLEGLNLCYADAMYFDLFEGQTAAVNIVVDDPTATENRVEDALRLLTEADLV